MNDPAIAALIGAALGAVFNAGVLWGTLRALLARVARIERAADHAHERINDLILRSYGGTD